MSKRLKVGDTVRVRKDAKGDHIRKSYSREKSVIKSRKFSMDKPEDRAFKVLIAGRKNCNIFWESDLELYKEYEVPGRWYDSRGVPRCPECGKKIKNKRRVYCCSAHAKLVMGRRYEEKRRYNEERKEYKREVSRKWRLKQKRKGLCSRCGKNKPDPGNLTCSDCKRTADLVRTRYGVKGKR